jgi:hypothetical protein
MNTTKTRSYLLRPHRPQVRLPALLAMLAMCLIFVSPSWATLSATADRTVISSNETLQLLVRLDSQALLGEPDFSVLENDFEILSTSRQQQYSRVNGQAQSFTDWNLVLAPKRVGKLLVPSIKYKKEISDAIEIEVRQASSASLAGQPIYTETLVDKSAVYNQEQLLLTHRLYTSVRLSDLSLEDLKVDDALVQKVSETQYQKTVGGKTYLVLEIVYAIFPQVSGKLDIPALRFAAFEASSSRFGGFSSRGNRIIRSTDAKTVDVMARPAHIDLDNWMPASKLNIKQEWSNQLDQLSVGEPITRTITITAQSLTAAQILPLPVNESDAYKIYPDQAQLDERADASGVTGIRRESFALVPNQAGEITLPAINVRWWDTAKQRMQTTSLDTVTLQVAPAKLSNPAPYTPAPAVIPQSASSLDPNQPLAITAAPLSISQPQPQSLVAELAASPILQFSLAINGLLLVLLLLLIFRKTGIPTGGRQHGSKSGFDPNGPRLELRQLLTNIDRAAKRSDLASLRDGILAWGRCIFPDQRIKTLAEIATLLEQPQLQEHFDLLDQALYNDAGDDSLDLKQLVQLLRNAIVPKQQAGRSWQTSRAELKPLYPES